MGVLQDLRKHQESQRRGGTGLRERRQALQREPSVLLAEHHGDMVPSRADGEEWQRPGDLTPSLCPSGLPQPVVITVMKPAGKVQTPTSPHVTLGKELDVTKLELFHMCNGDS